MLQAKNKFPLDSDETIQVEEIIEQQTKPIFHISGKKTLFILASTSSGIGVFFSGLAVFVSQFSEIIPYEKIYDEFQVFIKFGVLLIALAVFSVLLVARIVSVVITSLIITILQFEWKTMKSLLRGDFWKRRKSQFLYHVFKEFVSQKILFVS